jgi:hypothetical protein
MLNYTAGPGSGGEGGGNRKTKLGLHLSFTVLLASIDCLTADDCSQGTKGNIAQLLGL